MHTGSGGRDDRVSFRVALGPDSAFVGRVAGSVSYVRVCIVEAKYVSHLFLPSLFPF